MNLSDMELHKLMIDVARYEFGDKTFTRRIKQHSFCKFVIPSLGFAI